MEDIIALSLLTTIFMREPLCRKESQKQIKNMLKYSLFALFFAAIVGLLRINGFKAVLYPVDVDMEPLGDLVKELNENKIRKEVKKEE